MTRTLAIGLEPIIWYLQGRFGRFDFGGFRLDDHFDRLPLRGSRNAASELAVQVTGDPTFSVGQQQVLFLVDGYHQGNNHLDVSPDDQRFVMLRIEEETSTELIVVQNFFEELKERVPN